MAPEIFDNEYDKSIDIYAFGMFVLEISTLTTPYSECSGNPLQLYKKITEGEKPKAFDRIIDQDLRCFILKCIDLDKNKRPTASELLNDSFLEERESDNLDIKVKPIEKQQNEVLKKELAKEQKEKILIEESKDNCKYQESKNEISKSETKESLQNVNKSNVQKEKKSNGIEFNNRNSVESKIKSLAKQSRIIHNISECRSDLSDNDDDLKISCTKTKENYENNFKEIMTTNSNNESSELSIKKIKKELEEVNVSISVSKRQKLELLKDLARMDSQNQIEKNNTKKENSENIIDPKEKTVHFTDKVEMNFTSGNSVGDFNKAYSNKMSSVNDPPCPQQHLEVDSFFSLFNENTNKDNHNNLNNLNQNLNNEFNYTEPYVFNQNIQLQLTQQRSNEQNNIQKSYGKPESNQNIIYQKGSSNRLYGNYNNLHPNWDLNDYRMDHPQFDGPQLSRIEPGQLSIPENNTTIDSKEKFERHNDNHHEKFNIPGSTISNEMLPYLLDQNFSGVTNNTNAKRKHLLEKIPKLHGLDFKFYRDSEDLYIILNGKKENNEKVSSIYPTNVNQFLISVEKEFNNSIHNKASNRKNELYLWDIRDKLIQEIVHEKSVDKNQSKLNENNSLLKDNLHQSNKRIPTSTNNDCNQIQNNVPLIENIEDQNKKDMGKKKNQNRTSNTNLIGNNEGMQLNDSIWNFRKNYMNYYYNCLDPCQMSDHEESIESLKKRQEMELQLMQLWHQRQAENLIKNKKKSQVNSFIDKKQEQTELSSLRNRCKHFSRPSRKLSKSQDYSTLYNKDNYLKNTNNFANCDFNLNDARSSPKNFNDNYKMFANFNKEPQRKKRSDEWQLFDQIDTLDMLHNNNINVDKNSELHGRNLNKYIKTQSINSLSYHGPVLSKQYSYEDQIVSYRDPYGYSPQENNVQPFDYRINLPKHEIPLNLSSIGEQNLLIEESGINIDCFSKDQDEIQKSGLFYSADNLAEKICIKLNEGLEKKTSATKKLVDSVEKMKKQSSEGKINAQEKDVSHSSNLKINKESLNSQESSIKNIKLSENKASSSGTENNFLSLNKASTYPIDKKSPNSNCKSITNNTSSLLSESRNNPTSNNIQKGTNIKNYLQNNSTLNLTDTTCHKSGKTIEKVNISDNEKIDNQNSNFYDPDLDTIKNSQENHKKQSNLSVNDSFGEDGQHPFIRDKTISFTEESIKNVEQPNIQSRNTSDKQPQTPQNHKDLQNSFEITNNINIIDNNKKELSSKNNITNKIGYKLGSQNLSNLEDISRSIGSNNEQVHNKDLQTPSFNSKFDKSNIVSAKKKTNIQSINHDIDLQNFLDSPKLSNLKMNNKNNSGSNKKAESLCDETNILEMCSNFEDLSQNKGNQNIGSCGKPAETDLNLLNINCSIENTKENLPKRSSMKSVVSENLHFIQKNNVLVNLNDSNRSAGSIFDEIKPKDPKVLRKDQQHKSTNLIKTPSKNQDTPFIGTIALKEAVKPYCQNLENLFEEANQKKPNKVPDLNENQIELIKPYEMRHGSPISITENNGTLDVKIVQTCLKYLAFDDKFEATGNYGKYTAYLINKFKKQIKLPEDGEVDKTTFNKLKEEQYKKKAQK